MVTEATNFEQLREAYCPPIDEGLFLAIASDFDLPREHPQLVQVLDDLKQSALEQENTEFDPSGTGGGIVLKADDANLSQSSFDEKSISNDVTSITTGISGLRWSEDDGIGKELESLSESEKQQWLEGLFPNTAPEEIASLLRKSASLEQAVDELLNLSFISNDAADLENQSVIPKGIDGFANDSLLRPRKGRGKKKSRTNESSRASSAGSRLSENHPNTTNMWSAAEDDIDFICSRTSLPAHKVRSIYHANGARLSQTLRALSMREGTSLTSVDKEDPIVQLQIAEFKSEYPAVPDLQLYGLLFLARKIPSAAYELLDRMCEDKDTTMIGKVHGLAQYAPVELDKSDKSSTRLVKEPWTTTAQSNSRELAAAHGLAASQAFSQATTAYKRGKSDRLMGGAAAYYASVGHERLKAAKQLQSAVANAHVDGQSSTTHLDLHGVSVADAVRIASYKTHAWWDGLGDSKYVSGGRSSARLGYTIVTGVGTHSKNHAPRIGPAVSKMLVREGWDFYVNRGELVVTGKAKRG